MSFPFDFFQVSSLNSFVKATKIKSGGIKTMIVTSSGVVNGMMDKKYGKYGVQFYKGMPTLSLPLKFEGYPQNAKTFAIIMEDKDAIPPTGFSWIHWSVANLTKDSLEENASINAKDFVQGTNSWSSGLLSDPLDRYEAAKFGGPMPPDKPHTYEIHVFALDCSLELQNGFYVNELYKAMDGHVLVQYTLKAVYPN
jgi:Raf kinase inhibitor-like YbhB/YbcL family protein